MPDPENKKKKLSQQDEFTEVGSLSDYISKRLQDRAMPEEPSSLSTTPLELFGNKESPRSQETGTPQNNGMVLHHLDSQLVNNHLERYLPTPTTRFHLTHERLEKQLKGIYEELTQYRQFHGEEYTDKIEALEKRANLIRRKIFELDRNLSKLNPFQSMYRTLQKFSQIQQDNNPSAQGHWMIIPNPNRLKDEVTAINGELQSLHHILEEQLNDPCFTPQQLGRLVNEYDMSLRKAEKLAEQLKNRKSLWGRMSDKVTNWYKGSIPHQ